jgi:hypothetical protein
MTICAAVLAANSKAIVCIADKALTFDSSQEGGPRLQSIQWDSDCTKIVTLGQTGFLCAFSGGEDGISRVLSNLLARRHSAQRLSTCEIHVRRLLKTL